MVYIGLLWVFYPVPINFLMYTYRWYVKFNFRTPNCGQSVFKVRVDSIEQNYIQSRKIAIGEIVLQINQIHPYGTTRPWHRRWFHTTSALPNHSKFSYVSFESIQIMQGCNVKLKTPLHRRQIWPVDSSGISIYPMENTPLDNLPNFKEVTPLVGIGRPSYARGGLKVLRGSPATHIFK